MGVSAGIDSVLRFEACSACGQTPREVFACGCPQNNAHCLDAAELRLAELEQALRDAYVTLDELRATLTVRTGERNELQRALELRLERDRDKRARVLASWFNRNAPNAPAGFSDTERPTADDLPHASADAPATKLADELHGLAETAKEEERLCPGDPRGALRTIRGALRALAYASSTPRINCRPEHRLRVQGAKHFPAHGPGDQGKAGNMSKNQDVNSVVGSGAEGRTLSAGHLDQPETATSARFAKEPCQKLANGAPPSGTELNRYPSSPVQYERNGTGVQQPPDLPALIAARFALLWGSFDLLWCLALEFATLCRLGPGSMRRLDEFWTLGVGDESPRTQTPAFGFALYDPCGTRLAELGPNQFRIIEENHPQGIPVVPDELDALLRGAVDEARALREEIDTLDDAAEILRGPALYSRSLTSFIAHAWYMRGHRVPVSLTLWAAVRRALPLPASTERPELARAEIRAWQGKGELPQEELVFALERAAIDLGRHLREGVRRG